MKHFLLTGLLALSTCIATAQTMQKSLAPAGTIDIINKPDYNPGFSTYNNYANRLHNYEAPFMNSLLEMYETTGNAAYLDCFMVHAYNVIERRDDILALDPTIVVDGLGGLSKPTGGAMAWSFRLDPAMAWSMEIVNQGTIVFPLAKFAYLVKVKYPALQTRPAPASIVGYDATGWYYLDDFADCAEFLKIKADQTARGCLSAHWNTTNSCYYGYNSTGTYEPVSPNFMCSIGRVHTYMYKIYEAEGNATVRDYYLDKVRKISSRFLNPAFTGYSRDWANHLVSWKYGNPGSGQPFEDIAHGLLIVEFADLCNLFDIRDNSNVPLFDNSLMYDMANTFKTKIILSPLKYSLCVTGVDGQQTQISGTEGSVARYDHYMNAGRYLFLARHIPDIYNMIADYFYEYALYGPGTYPMYINDGAAQCKAADATAELAFGRTGYASVFKNYLDIASVKRNSTYQPGSDLVAGSVWQCVAAGKFDAASVNELFVTAKSGGLIQLRRFNTTNKAIENVLTTYTPGFTANWGGITAGDFVTGNNQSEFIAYNKSDNKLYLFRYDGTNIVSLGVYSTNINWAGIASGNMDGIAGDEAVLLSKDNGQVYVYRFVPFLNGYLCIAITITNQSTSTYVVTEASGIAVGNLDKNTANGLEIVTLNNNNGSDYNIKVLNMSFNGSNLTFTSAISYTGTSGNYSQWDGVTTGDFNGDGYDEVMLHRDYDGDFHIHYLDGGMIKSLCKENFPTTWDLGIMCSVAFPGDNTDHLISLRNTDGHIFVFRPYQLPVIASRPVDPEDPDGMVLQPVTESPSKAHYAAAYPNPTDGIVHISLSEDVQQLTVVSSSGQVVKQLTPDGSDSRVRIDLSDCPQGLYLLLLQTADGVVTQKIWKE